MVHEDGAAEVRPGLVPTAYLEVATAMVACATFDAEEDNELSMCEGQVVWRFAGAEVEGWSEVLSGEGVRGLVPASYIEESHRGAAADEPDGERRAVVLWPLRIHPERVSEGRKHSSRQRTRVALQRAQRRRDDEMEARKARDRVAGQCKDEKRSAARAARAALVASLTYVGRSGVGGGARHGRKGERLAWFHDHLPKMHSATLREERLHQVTIAHRDAS